MLVSDARIIKLEDFLKSHPLDITAVTEEKTVHSDTSEDDDDKEYSNVPKGRPKSGRIWKTEKTRASGMVKTRGLKQSLKKKQHLRQELKRIKEMSHAKKEERKKLKEEKRKRREENLKRQEENRKKSEIVQVIKNTSKIKRMKKKTLRKIEKRDTNDAIKN